MTGMLMTRSPTDLGDSDLDDSDLDDSDLDDSNVDDSDLDDSDLDSGPARARADSFRRRGGAQAEAEWRAERSKMTCASEGDVACPQQ